MVHHAMPSGHFPGRPQQPSTPTPLQVPGKDIDTLLRPPSAHPPRSQIPTIAEPPTSNHCPRPGGLHDLPKPDSATGKKALALVSGGKETKESTLLQVPSPLSFPNPLPFPSTVKQQQQQTRETIPSSRWRCTRIANVDALCPRSLPCDGRAARQSRMESAVLGLERESISSPPQRGSLQGEGDGGGGR